MSAERALAALALATVLLGLSTEAVASVAVVLAAPISRPGERGVRAGRTGAGARVGRPEDRGSGERGARAGRAGAGAWRTRRSQRERRCGGRTGRPDSRAWESAGRTGRVSVGERGGRSEYRGAGEREGRAARAGAGERTGRAASRGSGDRPGRPEYRGPGERPGRASRAGAGERTSGATYRGSDEARDDQLGSEVTGESSDPSHGVGESSDLPHGVAESSGLPRRSDASSDQPHDVSESSDLPHGVDKETGAVAGSDAGHDGTRAAGEGNEAQDTGGVADGGDEARESGQDAGSRRCGIRHRAVCNVVAQAKVRRVVSATNRMNLETSAQAVAANAKVLTAVGRLVLASRAGNSGPRASAKGSGKVRPVVHLRKRLPTKLRPNHQIKLFRNNSMVAVARANSQPISLDRGNVPGNATAPTPVADARNVAKPENGFRRSFRARALVRVVKSKIGFALGESLSMERQPFLECVLDRQITYASMDG